MTASISLKTFTRILFIKVNSLFNIHQITEQLFKLNRFIVRGWKMSLSHWSHTSYDIHHSIRRDIQPILNIGTWHICLLFVVNLPLYFCILYLIKLGKLKAQSQHLVFTKVLLTWIPNSQKRDTIFLVLLDAKHWTTMNS